MYSVGNRVFYYGNAFCSIVQSIQWSWNDLTSSRSFHHSLVSLRCYFRWWAINSNNNQINGIALLLCNENDFSNLFRFNNNSSRKEIECFLLSESTESTNHWAWWKYLPKYLKQRNANNTRIAKNSRIMIWMRLE